MRNDSSTTNSPGRKKFVLKIITNIIWFFICLFGALAALGYLFKMLKYPNWETFLQLGFVGGAAALAIMGSMQLGMVFTLEEAPPLQRIMSAVGFFLGIFAAMLTLGIFLTILRYPNAPVFLQLGLAGTAGALAATGLLKLGQVFTMEAPDEDDGDSGEI